MKFGGTSVKDAIAIKRVTNIVAAKDGKLIVVVSAFSQVTNSLTEIIDAIYDKKIDKALSISDEIYNKHIQVANDLKINGELEEFIYDKFDKLRQLIKAIGYLGEITPKSQDMVLSYGEILSSKIVEAYFHSSGLKSIYVDSRDLIITDSEYTQAEVQIDLTKTKVKDVINHAFVDSHIVVCGGFIASNEQGFTTTLGRGGSDYTASLIASMLNADRLEIWTDVDGILTSDPRLVENAKRILTLSYDEAAELAYFGAKVLHPKTIYPAVFADIPVYVLNSFKPEESGSLILGNIENTKIIKSIAFRKGITVINIQSNRMLGAYGFLSKVFKVFQDNETSVDIVTTSEVSISLTIDDDSKLQGIIKDLERFSKATVSKNKAIIASIGEGIRDTTGIAARFFNALSGINVKMVSIGASEVNLSIVVDESEVEEAIKLLHDEFFNDNINPEVFQDIN